MGFYGACPAVLQTQRCVLHGASVAVGEGRDVGKHRAHSWTHKERIAKSAKNLINIELFWKSYQGRRDLNIERNNTFKCPVMLVVGDQAPYEEAAVECNSKLDPTTTSFLKMADAGGMPQLTQPSKLTEAFKYFIQGMGYMASSCMTRLSRSRTTSLSSSYSMEGSRSRSRTLSQGSQGGQLPPSPSHTMEVSC
ncbi:protein NDRG2 [Cyprinus carpio]|uniref:Protein NDRG2 n=1 Tax=Cyprinus carpio TaxID=7962 RepID=A0A9Q9Y7Q1_CYPCA|nr:protein NDRG2 [Cyprinus carpio]